MNPQTKIGKKLREARNKLNQTQAFVAEQARINANFYARIERDEEVPSLETLKKILRVLKLKSSDILSF